VGDILEKEYRIPKYQRGYRWTKENVTKLLDDIYEDRLYIHRENEKLNENNAYKKFWSITFEENDDGDYEKPKSSYCIQPLVVMKAENEEFYDVIDGQQRLTTIAIIRAALNRVVSLISIEPAKISYESRTSSSEFLKYLYNPEIKPQGNNIDYDYMQQAFDVSLEYFNNLLENQFSDEKIRQRYASYLDDVLCKNTQFIWYEVAGAEPQKVFANFNTGKIELTNAELIKALFMDPANYNAANIKDKQIVISEKWDEIENKLHEPEFWAFVPHPNQYETNSKQYSTRIDIIFDFLVMEIWLENNPNKNIEDYISVRNGKSSDKYIFYEIEAWMKERLSTSPDKEAVIDECWRRIGKIFSGLKELFSADNRIFNIVGLYINLRNRKEENVDEYVDDNNDLHLRVYNELNKVLKMPRSEREGALKTLVREEVFKGKEAIKKTIKNMKYNEGKSSDTVKLLLIYNIALLSTSKGTGERFNFLANARNKWEREHIFATNVKSDANAIERKAALEILSGDDYIKYVKYIFDIKFPIEFSHENNKYQLDLTSDSINDETIDNFITSNLAYSGNGQNEILARALRTKKRANEVLECYFNINKIEQILAEEAYYLKKLLAYKYISGFDGKFHFVDNIDFRLSENYKTIIENAKSEGIEFESLEFTYTLNDYNDNKDSWKNWLCEQGQEENKTKYDDLFEKIRSTYQSKLEDTIYSKANNITELKDSSSIFDGSNDRFIFASLKLNEITLSYRINAFFENDLPRLLQDNCMGNMTLLTGNKERDGIQNDKGSSGQNQSVSNKPYNQKKEMVYNFYKEGQFVPLGTLFVFTDLYTKGTNAANFWLPDSRFKYLKDMIETISSFLGEKEGDKE
jgi:hypothetical protein